MKTKDVETIGSRLKRLRQIADLSVSEVAKRLQVAPSTYREWEYGRRIRGEPYEKLAAIFRVSIEEIILGNRDQESRALELLVKVEKTIADLKKEIHSLVVKSKRISD